MSFFFPIKRSDPVSYERDHVALENYLNELGLYRDAPAPVLLAQTTNPGLSYTTSTKLRYSQIGKTVHVQGAIYVNTVWGTGAGDYRITLPVPAVYVNVQGVGVFTLWDNSTNLVHQGLVLLMSSTIVEFLLEHGTNLPTSPYWNATDLPVQNTDSVTWTFTYEAA